MANGVRLTPKRGWGKQQTSELMSAVGTDSTKEGDSSTPSGTPPAGSSDVSSAFTPGSGGGGQVKPVQPVSPKQTKGSGFTNVQRILKASGTEGGPSRLAQSVVGGVQQAATGAQQGLAGAKQEFAGKIAPVQSSLEQAPTQATAIVERAKSGQDVSGDVEAWKKLTSGAYTGPTELSFSPQQTRQAAESAALSKLAGGVEGRSALLQKYVGSPQYGTSKQTLDALLLGKGGSSAIRGALRQGAKTEQEIAREQAVSKARAAALQQGFAGVAEEAKTELGQATTELKTGLETSKKTFVENEIQNAVNRVVNSLRTGGNVSRKDLNLLNLREEDFKNLRYQAGTEGAPVAADIIKSLRDYYGKGEASKFASPEQRAAIGALGQLSDQQNLGLNLLDSVYDLDTSQTAYFNLPAYKEAVEKKIQDRLVNDPGLVKQKDAVDYLSGVLDSVTYQNSDVLSDIGNMFGLTGYNKFDLNDIADSINVGKTSFQSIRDNILDWINETKPANFTYRDSRGKVINMGRDLAYEGDPYNRKINTANALAELAFLKAEEQNKYNQQYNKIKNIPTLSFKFTD